MLRNVFFVRALQKAIKRRACGSLGIFHQLLQPYHFLRLNLQLRPGALIMRTVFADFLGAGAQRLHRHNSCNTPTQLLTLLGLIHAIDIHRCFHATHRSLLRYKIRELQLDKSSFSLQMLLQLVQNCFHISETHRAESAQTLHKTAHVRTAHIMRQIHRQCYLRYAVLRTACFIAQLNRPAQALYSNMLQRNIT